MDTNYTHPAIELSEAISAMRDGSSRREVLARLRRYGLLGARSLTRPANPHRIIEIGIDGDPLVALRVRRGDVAIRAEVDGDLDDALLVVASTANTEFSLDAGVVEVDVFDCECEHRLSYRVAANAGESTSSVLRRWFWREVVTSDHARVAAVRSALVLLADLLIDQALGEEPSR